MKINRKYTACLYTAVLLAAVVCVTIVSHLLEKSRVAEQESAAQTTTTDLSSTAAEDPLQFTVADRKISLWHKDNRYYAFLPSACKEAGLEPEISEDIDPDSIIHMYSEHIPAVFIETESGTSDLINNDKNIREAGTITVLEPDGSISLEHTLEYIKGRGNTSYTEFDKKPYQIKLTESAPFLGMDPGKKWVFISNSADSTLVRNALSRSLAKHLGLAQSEEGTFVDLYLNREYMGNYYVVEKIEVQENRLENPVHCRKVH